MSAIHTIEYHEKALKQISANQQRRIEQQLDVSDCALSSWGDSSMARFHHVAIDALKKGLEVTGEEVPYGDFTVLCDADNNVICTTTVSGQWNTSWKLSAAMAEKYGRRFLPTGKRSRVQKQLGLSEQRRTLPAKNYTEDSCACIGAPVSYRLVIDTSKLNH